MRYFLILLLLLGCAKQEEKVSEINIMGSLSKEELSHPDFIDANNVGWTLINTEEDGYYKQKLIKTPFYRPKPELSWTEKYNKQRLERE